MSTDESGGTNWAENATNAFEIVEQFDAAWQAAMAGRREPPRIEAFLKQFGHGGAPSRTRVMEELLAVELECRRQRGEAPSRQEYQDRFPGAEHVVAKFFSEAQGQAEQAERGGLEPSDFAPRRRLVRMNCPHCLSPIAVAEELEEEVVCPKCGSSFRLDRDNTESWRPEKLPRLGKFQLLEPLGRGAFGTVYRALDAELDRIVAVKVPRRGTFTTEEAESRFVREARSLAQLHHPGIVAVYEAGHCDQFPYIVSEYIDGITLADALSGRRFTFRESAKLVLQVAEALEHAHRQKVIHRDLKPSNIMLERVGEEESRAEERSAASTLGGELAAATDTAAGRSSGFAGTVLPFRARLMDFGLARREEGGATVTVEGQVLGTPAYMSPEQARGEGHRVDGRSDVYSLGVILCHLV